MKKKNWKITFFHLNFYNFFIFKYFYLENYLDTLEIMLFEIKINIIVDLSQKHINAYFLGKKQCNIYHRLCIKKIF